MTDHYINFLLNLARALSSTKIYAKIRSQLIVNARIKGPIFITSFPSYSRFSELLPRMQGNTNNERHILKTLYA